MQKTRLKLSAFVLLVLGLTGIQAQEVIPAAGGNASGSGGSMSYSVGQVVYSAITGINGSVTQGSQQPYEISIVLGIEEVGIKLNLLAYPNPTTDFLMLQIDNFDSNTLYQLYTITGELLQSKKVTEMNTSIKMEQLPTAIYLLKIIQNNKEIKTFKIVKR